MNGLTLYCNYSFSFHAYTAERISLSLYHYIRTRNIFVYKKLFVVKIRFHSIINCFRLISAFSRREKTFIRSKEIRSTYWLVWENIYFCISYSEASSSKNMFFSEEVFGAFIRNDLMKNNFSLIVLFLFSVHNTKQLILATCLTMYRGCKTAHIWVSVGEGSQII